MDSDPNDKYFSRRARLTTRIAARINAAHGQADRRRVEKALEEACREARRAALRGDLCAAEALAAYLRVYLPALRAHAGTGGDPVLACRFLHGVRVLKAVQGICAGEAAEEEPA